MLQEACGGRRSRRPGQRVEGSHLLVATGRSPNTERLDLATVGVETDERGLVPINGRLQTNVPGIWAVVELAAEPSVDVAYSPPGDACWISITGTSLVVEGGDKGKSPWNRSAGAWFSGGPTDPDLAVVQVRIVHVSEWQAGAAPDSRPVLRSEAVGLRPPDHLPTETTPASENAALLFERS